MLRGTLATVFTAILMIVCPAFSQWRQDEFTIAAWYFPLTGDPAGDSARMEKMKDANFNTIAWGGHFDFFSTVDFIDANRPARASCKAGLSLAQMIAPKGSYRSPNEYWLSIAHKVGGIRLLVEDRTILGFDHTNLTCVDPVNGCRERLSNTAKVYACYSNHRAAMMGYFIGDEPAVSRSFDDSLNFLDNFLKKTEYLCVNDPDKLAWFNLRPYFGFKSWEQYKKEYVSKYIRHPYTRVVSFDYYPFFTSKSGPSNGYFSMNNPDGHCHYFRHLKLFADSAKGSGKAINFWGIGHSCDEYSPNGGHSFTYPADTLLRYYASSFLLYGAKGIIWYTYGLQDTTPSSKPGSCWSKAAPESDPALYAVLKNLNAEIKRMGPVFMKLSWQKTLHGTRIDPSSGEINLDTLTPASAPFYGDAKSALGAGHGKDSIAIGVFKDSSGLYYLAIMNKSVFFDKNTKSWSGLKNAPVITVTHKLFPRQFDKSSGGWKALSRTYNPKNNVTSFTVEVNPGDMQLVWLSP